MLAFVVIIGVLTFLSFLSIMFFLLTGKYDQGKENDPIIEENPQSIRIRKSVSMNMWDAFVKAFRGEVQFIPILLLFVLLHALFFFIFLYLLEQGAKDKTEETIYYIMLAMLPISFIRMLWRAYTKRSR
ncbi:MAG TPA: hypothetical protein PK863_06300 [Candidatus Dojkabacteria bacterium]|nr:hypothetical protein [Candidatus Dojkabacteria bacterium]HRP37465.1 hypothetical protein [Candidatus Dojkabacteria bacterium]HRP51274.1 hypothetical protein [Candidatus Dojkabacteria bacterium]